jgi:hypothetical protein
VQNVSPQARKGQPTERLEFFCFGHDSKVCRATAELTSRSWT